MNHTGADTGAHDELKQKIGMSIIMITHDLGIVANMCQKIAVMYGGKVVECGTADEIFYNPRHEYTKGLLRSIPRLTDKEHRKLIPIEGTPVDMLNPPAGCPFAPRCNSCMKICLGRMPEYTDLSETHYSACWLCRRKNLKGGAGSMNRLIEVKNLKQYFRVGGSIFHPYMSRL